jgi:hypothetical protein
VLCLMLALSMAPWRVSFRLTVQQAVDDGPGLLVISGFISEDEAAAVASFTRGCNCRRLV